jgi:quercetin dioxygenase-like cupin family protein
MSNQKRTAALSVSAMVIILAFSPAVFAQSTAMEKAGAMQPPHQRKVTVLAENEKLQVIDVVYQPGDIGAVSSKDGLVVYHLSSGTVERSYADGSKEVMNYKAGQTMIISEKRPYSTKNIGQTAVHEIVVQLK